MKPPSQRNFQLKCLKKLSRKNVQTSGFVLGLTGAIAASLFTWQSADPAFASYSYTYGEPDFNSINVFGDSLVDSGNFFDLTSAFAAEGVPMLPPSPPYAQKFSNGSVWVENLAQDLGLPLISRSRFSSSTLKAGVGINFGFGGALSSNVNSSDADIPALADGLLGFQEQVSNFISLSEASSSQPYSAYPYGEYQAQPSSDALTVVWVGGNDYFAAVTSPESLGDLSLEQLPDAVTDNIIDGILQLSGTGAKDFLVVNLPPLGDIPLADFLDAQSEGNASSVFDQLTAAHNEQLSQKLSTLEQNNAGLNIIPLDANALFTSLADDPDEFGLANTTEPCLINFRPSFQFEGVCDNPDQFVFWDDVHPTAATHRLISDFAIATLQAEERVSVPEPTSLIPLCIFGIVGAGAIAKYKWERI